MKQIALIIGGLLLVLFAAVYFGEDHQQYLAFDEQRNAWHRKCDVYRGKPLVTPDARACNVELEALVAYGRKQGWTD